MVDPALIAYFISTSLSWQARSSSASQTDTRIIARYIEILNLCESLANLYVAIMASLDLTHDLNLKATSSCDTIMLTALLKNADLGSERLGVASEP